MSGATRVPRPRGIPGVDLSGLRHELPALLAFRWRLAGRPARWSVALVSAVVLGLGVGVPLTVAVLAPRPADQVESVLLLLPTAWAFFALSVLISAVASAGGRELLPRSQAVALPVSPAADSTGALLMVPLNLAWTIQAVGLLTVAAYLTAEAPGITASAMLMTLLWIVAASTLAQFIGWAAELLRTYRHGESVLRGLALVLAAVAVAVVGTGNTAPVLDRLPTRDFTFNALTADPAVFAVTAAVLCVLAAVCFVGAVPLVAVLARRPSPLASEQETRTRPRRSGVASDMSWAVGLDRRVVTRTSPLRRGLAVLILLPLGAAALVEVPWLGIVVLPALIASATGLLYGVNAFALDGSGALWRDSLPQSPRQWLDSRVTVLAQVCGAAVAAVVVVAAVRSPAVPNLAEVVAVGCAGLVAVVQVTSRCARWSVRHPFAVDLRLPRDAPGPPLAMAGYSIALAVATTLSGVAFSLAASTGNPAVPAAVLVPFAVSGLWSLRRTAALFETLPVRSRVTTTVSGA